MTWEERYQKEMLRRICERLIRLGIPDVESLLRGVEPEIERIIAENSQMVEAPQLTRVFCQWDKNWIEPIDLARHKISFNRPTTMGYGGKECPFIFTRIG
jgi:hypothetical protein